MFTEKDHQCTYKLTLTVLVATTDAQWEGMGDVGSVRYKPALLPSCLTIRVLSYCITSTFSEIQHFKGLKLAALGFCTQSGEYPIRID